VRLQPASAAVVAQRATLAQNAVDATVAWLSEQLFPGGSSKLEGRRPPFKGLGDFELIMLSADSDCEYPRSPLHNGPLPPKKKSSSLRRVLHGITIPDIFPGTSHENNYPSLDRDIRTVAFTAWGMPCEFILMWCLANAYHLCGRPLIGICETQTTLAL
jgi:hypothetical protein